jgi:type IV pilus assembly protein PilF
VGAVARRHPVATIVLLLLVLPGAAAGGLYAYAIHQWHTAQAALKESRAADAQPRLDFCLSIWPHSIPVRILAARAARMKGDFETAEEHLNACLKLPGGRTEAVQVEFLLMRAQRGEEDEVAPELMLYVDNGSPEAPLILETLARAYMYNIRYGPAYGYLTRWMALAPDSPEPVRWRGWVLERLNDFQGAMNDYKQALKLDPELVPVRLRLAEMYLDSSNPPEALPLLERLHSQFPDRADIQARLGQCRFLQGDVEEARRLLEPASEQLPKDVVVRITLGKLELQQKRPAEAEPWLRRALQIDPLDTEAEFTLVAALQAQNRDDEAKAVLAQHQKDMALNRRVSETLQREAEGHPASPDALAEAGATFLRTNDRIGLYWLYRALQRDPGHQGANKALAEYYENKPNPDLEKAAAHRRRLKTEAAPAAKQGKPRSP